MDKIKKTPIYQVIFNDLFEKIKNGYYKVGDQIPTEKELMNQYQTSRITASRAVHELENKNYVKRTKAIGTFVTPESQWEENKKNKAAVTRPEISVIIPSPKSNISIEMEVLQGIGIACGNLGYTMSIHSNESNDTEFKTVLDFEKALISEIMEQGSVGAIIFPSTTSESPEIYNLMSRKSFPFVLLDREVFGVEASIVTSNNRDGFYSIVEHIISEGHRKIAFVSGDTHESSCRRDRYYGYVKALNDYKLKVEDRLVIHHLFPENYNNRYYQDIGGENEYYKKSIKEMLENFLSFDEPPTAIVTSNDYIALNIMSVASAMGINIPNDISITGFDGLTFNSFITPLLTTVAQDFLSMGQSSVSLLDQIIKNPQRKIEKITIPTTLVAGKSVKAL